MTLIGYAALGLLCLWALGALFGRGLRWLLEMDEEFIAGAGIRRRWRS